ncbi:MAG: hypothetical protein LAT68_10240 [Cyclobacteriaceae bacterium]|nr:hypothetical protein [Cyclobacteriaceae bacterium]MCH8516693.1 hypothetical protein [Cyclobacteriaceae bacterium]
MASTSTHRLPYLCLFVFCWLFLFAFPIEALAQGEADSFAWSELDDKRLAVNKTGMYILGSWAIGNIAVSGARWAAGSDGTANYFDQMNVYWNIVNLGIAGFGLYQAINASTSANFLEAFDAHQSIQKVLLINAALDLGYMAGGFWMREYSRRPNVNSEQWRGFGNSVIMQGAFLMLFDIALAYIHSQDTQAYHDLFQNLYLSPEGMGLRFKF